MELLDSTDFSDCSHHLIIVRRTALDIAALSLVSLQAGTHDDWSVREISWWFSVTSNNYEEVSDLTHHLHLLNIIEDTVNCSPTGTTCSLADYGHPLGEIHVCWGSFEIICVTVERFTDNIDWLIQVSQAGAVSLQEVVQFI